MQPANLPKCRRCSGAGSLPRMLMVLVVVTTVSDPPAAVAQLPAAQLDGLYPLGATTGSEFELVISGQNLDEPDRLIFSHPKITAKRKVVDPTPFQVGPQPVPNTFVVTVDPSVLSGRYEIRCQGRYGLSNPRRFEVRSGQQVSEVEPNNDAATATNVTIASDEAAAAQQFVPLTIDGRFSGNADVDVFEVTGPAGQILLIDVMAQQLDSTAQTVLSVVDDAERVLTTARSGAGSDPLAIVTIPESGRLFLKVHDAQFRQGDAFSYRIVLSQRPQIDYVDPPVAVAGRSNSFTVYGRHLPAGQKTDALLDGQPLYRQQVTIDVPADAGNRLSFSGRVEPHVATVDGFEYRLQHEGIASNPLLLTVTDHEPILEQPDNDRPESAQKLSLPAQVAGRFYPDRDVDWYTFEAKGGQQIVIDLLSHRLGLPTDPTLLVQRIVQREDGTQQVSDVVFLDDVRPPQTRNESGRHEFETSSADPTWLLDVPADGTYRLLIRDSYSSLHSYPRAAYRLIVREPQPDVRIVAVPAESIAGLQLRREGRQLIRVFADRIDGFDEAIRVKLDGLPAGVTSDEITIGPGNRMGTLVLTATAQAEPGIASVRVSATAEVDGKTIQREARYGAASVPYRMGQPNSRLPNVPARLTDGIQLMVLDEEPAPALLTLGDGKELEICRGMNLKIPYTAKKRDEIGGNLLAFPMDFPQNSNAGQVNIGNNQQGTFDLRINTNAPHGDHTFYLAGYLQNMPYRHNPESVDRAKQQQEHVGKVLDEANEAVQKSQQAAQEAQNALNQANAQLNVARQARTTADQKRVAAKTKVDAAKNLLTSAQQQAAANPDDETLQQNLQKAEESSKEAAEELSAAVKELEEATKQLTAAEAAVKDATATKAEADEKSNKARQFQQQAQAEKRNVDQRVRVAEQAARQRNINVVIPSNSLKLKLTEFPIEWQSPTAGKDQSVAATIAQGQSADIKLRFKRLYDYKGNVSVQVQQPAGVSGLNINNINIGGGSSEGVLKLNVASTATTGDHTLALRITFSGLNGTLVMEQPLRIRVSEVKKEA